MSKYRKHVDDFFKEKLGRYKETPPADVWDDLDKRLDGLAPQAPGTSYRWLLHVGIVSLLVVLSVSVVRKMTGNTATAAANDQAIAQASIPAAGTGANANNTPAATNITNNKENGSNSSAANNNGATGNNSNNVANNVAGNQKTNNSHRTATTKNTNGNKQSNPGNKASQQPAENNYNAVVANNGAKEEYTADNGKGGPMANVATDGPAAVKKELPKSPVANKDAAPKKANTPAEQFSRFEAGIKVGFEKGFNDGAASKYVVTPYLQYNLSPRFAILTQPSVKAATISNRNIGTAENYYSVDPNQKVANTGTTDNYVQQGGTPLLVSTTATYSYTQYHDSIVKSSTFGGTYMEFEIPLLAKYNITKTVSVYGGVNLVYSKLMNVTEHTYTSQPIGRTVGTPIEITTPAGEQAIAPPASVNADIAYTGTPISNYQGAGFAAPAGSFRVGYMAGFTYEYTKRWLIDALIQQAPIKPDVQGGYNLNSPLSSTYLRLSIGYKLTK